jgi:hypothetical protein
MDLVVVVDREKGGDRYSIPTKGSHNYSDRILAIYGDDFLHKPEIDDLSRLVRLLGYWQNIEDNRIAQHGLR